jgi:hypothetical protein
MARIRTVKPELFRHEGLFELEQETGLPVRLAFIGLFTACDREGRFKWRPLALKLDALPFDNVDFSRVLNALESRGFVVRYRVGNDDFGCIPTFVTHQAINNKESQSVLPSPNEARAIVHENQVVITRESRVDNACPSPLGKETGEGKGREGKGRENASGTRGTAARFSPPKVEEVIAYMQDKGCQNPGVEGQRFVNHYESNGWKVGKNPMKNWHAAASGWLSRNLGGGRPAPTRLNQDGPETLEDLQRRAEDQATRSMGMLDDLPDDEGGEP